MEYTSLLLANAVILGFRHGFDWDHVAAIVDITGTSSAKPQDFPGNRWHPLLLSSLYALGHAAVVCLLGLGALCFGQILPAWVDPIMERLVGLTLLVLGFSVLLSFTRYFQGKDDFHMQSRWMLCLALAGRLRLWLCSKFKGKPPAIRTNYASLDAGGAIFIGMLHGTGAETGSQILLILALANAQNHMLGQAMLFSFLSGLLLANTFVALLATTSFLSAKKLKPLYLTCGALTCVFSFAVGALFCFGQGQRLAELRQLLGLA